MAIYSGYSMLACSPISLADTLLRTAEKQLFRPVWSERILAETMTAIVRVHPNVDPKLIEERMWFMNATFPSAMVGGLDELESGLSLPDPNDNHVVAAAYGGRRDAILTANLRYFPAKYFGRFGLEAKSSDDFLLNQSDLATRPVLDCLREQAEATHDPSLEIEELLVNFGRAGAPNFADEALKRIQ